MDPRRQGKPMLRGAFVAILACALSTAAAAAKPTASFRCYQAKDKVECFLRRAEEKLQRVHAIDERVDATVEVLYTLAVTGTEDDELLKQAMHLAEKPGLAPYRQMSLLYAIDLYQFAQDSPLADASYAVAQRRFRELEQALAGNELLDLYIGACSMLAWEDDFLDRWSSFLPEACNPEKLAAVKTVGSDAGAWVMAMMPAAMTVTGDWDRYKESARIALAWLDSAAARGAAKDERARDLVDRLGVVMYSLNSISLQLFEEPDAADGALDASLKYLHQLEKRVGITGRSTPSRRPVAEVLFRSGRDKEAAKLLREMLVRVDADPRGKRISFREQAAILALAANFEDFLTSGAMDAARPETKKT
jgi:hypothetical protein